MFYQLRITFDHRKWVYSRNSILDAVVDSSISMAQYFGDWLLLITIIIIPTDSCGWKKKKKSTCNVIKQLWEAKLSLRNPLILADQGT